MSALASYRDALIGEAATICDEALAHNLRQPRVLRLRALLCRRDKQYAAGTAYLVRAAALEPSDAGCYLDLSDLLLREHRSRDAVNACLRAVTLDTASTSAYIHLGRALCQGGLLSVAVAVYQLALLVNPTDAVLYRELGDAIQLQGRLPQAVAQYKQGLELTPHDPCLCKCLGQAWLHLKEWNLALAAFKNGLTFSPHDADLQTGVGDALIGLSLFTSAASAYRTALTRDPDHLGASSGLAHALDLLGDRASDTANAWLHLGTALQTRSRYSEATAAYREAVARKPDCLGALVGLARACLAQGRPIDAIQYCNAALAVDPEHHTAHVLKGQASFLAGDIKSGWDGLAWHYRSYEFGVQSYDCPLWDGSTLTGLTILLWTDQGLGDSIQFLRYIDFVKSRGARIVVQSHHRSLVPIIKRITGVDQIIAPGSPLPPLDFHAPLVYFPAIVRPHPDIAQRVPYIDVEPPLVDIWRQKLGAQEGRYVGLSWGGNAWHRSAPSRFVPLRLFGRLAGIQGTRLVSLQHGPQAAELLAAPQGLHVTPIVSGSTSILDVAAAILSIDLVITVDTMIAHLAGALGKPVWTLLRYAADWMWGIEGDSTPWYPTMRLFRQTREGDWTGVFDRVREALETPPS